MRNRILTITTLGLALTLLTAALPALAEDKPAETAVYAIAHLADDGVMKELAGALAPLEGIVSAQADSTGEKFLVTFTPGKTAPEALTKAIAKVAPESRFEGVRQADGKVEAGGCGQCPSKATCGSRK